MGSRVFERDQLVADCVVELDAVAGRADDRDLAGGVRERVVFAANGPYAERDRERRRPELGCTRAHDHGRGTAETRRVDRHGRNDLYGTLRARGHAAQNRTLIDIGIAGGRDPAPDRLGAECAERIEVVGRDLVALGDDEP
jgi:hypothetical protein